MDILLDLGLLSDQLRDIERDRLERERRGERAAITNREAAQKALTQVVMFFQQHQIEGAPLIPLLSDLVALTNGSTPSAMLLPEPTSHRRPDPPTLESIKGRVAAFMEYRQETGSTRREAAAWVARSIPKALADVLGASTAAAIDSWLTKWGGKHGSPSNGRDGYSAMRDILVERRPNEAQLKTLIALLVRWGPPRESK